MKKLLLVAMIAMVAFVSTSNAASNGLWVMDSPTANILPYGAYNIDIKFISEGGVQTKLNFGVFKIFNLGIGLELAKFIGNESVKVSVPALCAKLQIYGGDMSWPAFAIGYDGLGYGYDADLPKDYTQLGKGLYFVVGREAFFEGLMLNMGLNINDFSDSKVYGFFNAIVPVYEETVFAIAEYDNLHNFSDARLNMGARCAVTEYLNIDFFVRDCWGSRRDGVPNERIFRFTYTGKF